MVKGDDHIVFLVYGFDAVIDLMGDFPPLFMKFKGDDQIKDQIDMCWTGYNTKIMKIPGNTQSLYRIGDKLFIMLSQRIIDFDRIHM